MSRIRAAAERHGVLLLLALAFLTRSAFLTAAGPDLDETWSWAFVDTVRASGHFRQSLAQGLDAPLFAGLNVVIAQIFGLSLTGLRLPQAVFGTLAVPLVYLVVRRLHSRRLGLLSALLATLSPFLVFYSKQARPYAQLLFFALLFTYAFYRWRGSWRARLLPTACAVLVVGSHYYGLVYLAAFFALNAAARVRGRDWSELRRDLACAALSLAATAPLVVWLLDRLERLSVPYWNTSSVTLPGVISEQFLFMGTTLPPGGSLVLALDVAVLLLLLSPLVAALRRGRERIGEQPVIALLWLLMPGSIYVLGLVLGRDLLFYPRGFITAAPFLLAYWALFTPATFRRAWVRRLYVSVLLLPFTLSSVEVALSSPAQSYYRGRELMGEIVRRAEEHRAEYDLILVHHWFMAQYFRYYSTDRGRVRGLGMPRPGSRGERNDLLDDLAGLPPESRVLLVLNDLASLRTDRDGLALRTLRAERPVLTEFACHDSSHPGATLLCNRMILFGPQAPPQR